MKTSSIFTISYSLHKIKSRPNQQWRQQAPTLPSTLKVTTRVISCGKSRAKDSNLESVDQQHKGEIVSTRSSLMARSSTRDCWNRLELGSSIAESLSKPPECVKNRERQRTPERDHWARTIIVNSWIKEHSLQIGTDQHHTKIRTRNPRKNQS